MQAVKIKENVYWVGGVDWTLRNFHGYLTQRGSTYNAYLIIDEKVTLIDTVKHYLFDEMLQRIRSVIEPEKIDCMVCNHVEMDHSGSFPRMRELAPNATIYASPKGVEGLQAHYDDIAVTPVKTGDTVSIGKRTLSFIQTPMVHWPDNMWTYCPEDRILFSNDGFGQHLASEERFDDQFPLDILVEEAAKYYANIVFPYGNQVQKGAKALEGKDIDTLAPSHGLIWRQNIGRILELYGRWSTNATEDRAVVVYDTMWNSTRMIAEAVCEGFHRAGLTAEPVCLQATHISDVMTKLLTAKFIGVGSPTLNSNILPTVGAFLTYLSGLAPKNRVGMAFGSYGWGGQSPKIVNDSLAALGWTMLETQKIKYIPSAETLESIAASTATSVADHVGQG